MEENEIELKNNSIIHKNKSLTRLDLSFLKHIELSEYKKSNLLAYWIHDYAVYHDEEKDFDTTKIRTFKRGDIIKANLGFNIGSELGGLHYCIVLDKYDNPKNASLNVIPLTSKKTNKTYLNSSVNLGKELYNILKCNLAKENDKLNNLLKELEKLDDIPENIQNVIKIEQKYIDKMNKEISKMKQDSIALINQITTISKQRLFDDIILRKVHLSSNSLNLIDSYIVKYFTK